MTNMHNAFPIFAIFAGAIMIGGVFVAGALVQQDQSNYSKAYIPSRCPTVACAKPPVGCNYVKEDAAACGCGKVVCVSPLPSPKASAKPTLRPAHTPIPKK